jgi:hypothetical protein
MMANLTLDYTKTTMVWSNRIKAYSDLMDKAILNLKSVTDKSSSVQDILDFIRINKRVNKKQIMKHIGWGVGITFSPYRQYLRNHPSIEFEWDGQMENYVAV